MPQARQLRLSTDNNKEMFICAKTHSPALPSPRLLLSLLLSVLDVERDGVNMTVCAFPFNSGTPSDKKIVTAVGTTILFGCVLYSW